VPIYSARQGVKFSSTVAGPDGECGIWADILQPSGAEVLGTYTAGAHAGQAALTMNGYGKGKAVYIGADLDTASLSRVLRTLSALAGVEQPLDVPPGVEMTVRTSGDKRWIFLLNHLRFADCRSSENLYRSPYAGSTHWKDRTKGVRSSSVAGNLIAK
jgi:beta-galactosidase